MAEEIKKNEETEEKKENRVVTFVKAHWKDAAFTVAGFVAGVGIAWIATTDKTGLVKAVTENPIGFGTEGTEVEA